MGAGYDIALIKLRFELNFDSDLTPICLSLPLKPLTNDIKQDSCQIIQRDPRDLTKIRNQPIDFVDCHKIYKNLINDKYMTCAADACISDGDTGGPLFCKNRTNPEKWILTGIASWPQTRKSATDLCGPNPDVFTKLFDNDYITWINSTICVN